MNDRRAGKKFKKTFTKEKIEEIKKTAQTEFGAIITTLHFFAQRSPASVVEYREINGRVYGIFILRPATKIDNHFFGKLLRWHKKLGNTIEKYISSSKP